MHRGRSDTAVNANANSHAPGNSLANLSHQISNTELQIMCCEGIRNANANGFANEIATFRPRCGNSLRMEVCEKIRSRLRMRWLGAFRCCLNRPPPQIRPIKNLAVSPSLFGQQSFWLQLTTCQFTICPKTPTLHHLLFLDTYLWAL